VSTFSGATERRTQVGGDTERRSDHGRAIKVSGTSQSRGVTEPDIVSSRRKGDSDHVRDVLPSKVRSAGQSVFSPDQPGHHCSTVSPGRGRGAGRGAVRTRPIPSPGILRGSDRRVSPRGHGHTDLLDVELSVGGRSGYRSLFRVL